MSNYSNQSRVVIGLIIIAAGALLLMRNLNIFTPLYHLNFLFSWKMILVVIGLILFFISGNRSSGIILMIIGGFFLIPDILGIPHFHLWRIGLPLILILVGLMLILRRGFDHRITAPDKSDPHIDYLNEVSIFAGIEKNITIKALRGGRITSIFGGVEINLANSKLAEGRNYLDLFVMFGGVSLYVPEDWDVRVDVVSILGGFTDSRTASRLKVEDPAGELVIKGIVLLGGGEIKTV